MCTNKLKPAGVLLSVFVMAFIVTFLAIFFTQSTYSKPVGYMLIVNDMEISVGPPPNATNVSLDTVITVDALASAVLNDLQIVPETTIARVHSEVKGPLTYLKTFYPAELLKPNTCYNVSVTIMGAPIEWSFSTASAFKPGIGFYVATNSLWISVVAAVTAVALTTVLLNRRLEFVQL